MNRAQLAAEIAVAEREIARRTLRQRLRDSLFTEQRALFDDTSNLKSACCGRRAGKTHTAGVGLIEAAESAPGSLSLGIGLTAGSAREFLWPAILELNKTFELGYELRDSDMVARHPYNGAAIRIGGCPDRAHTRTFRGALHGYRRVIIDEGAFYGAYLEELVYQVLRPALIDTGGDLWLLSSPGIAPVGLYHDVVMGKRPGWSRVHQWNLTQNPHLPTGALEQILRENAWTPDHPTFVREYLGLWRTDPSMLVYSGYSAASLVDALPAVSGWHYSAAIDLGTAGWQAELEDGQSDRQGDGAEPAQTPRTTAYAVTAFHDLLPTAYLIESGSEYCPTPTDVAHLAERLQTEYHPDTLALDAGGLGGGYIVELRKRHGLPVVAAEKSDKRAFIEHMNGDLQTGALKVIERSNRELVGAWSVLPWADETRQAEKTGVPNHVPDAALYAWRHARGWVARRAAESQRSVPRETPEQQAARMAAEELAAMAKKPTEQWWRRRR